LSASGRPQSWEEADELVRQAAYETAMHLISEHGKVQALWLGLEDNDELHSREHHLDGSRIHEPARLNFDDAKIESVLDGAEKAEGIPGAGCPDGGTCHHLCHRACYRVQSCAPLSGVYADDWWPSAVLARHKAEPVAVGWQPSFEREQAQYAGELRRIQDGTDPISVQRYRRRTSAHASQEVWAVQLTRMNWQSVCSWLLENDVHADWTPEPPRLHFGGRLGFSVPPGEWIAIPYGDFGAEVFDGKKFGQDWRQVT
jgi:hypothetical protein